MRCPVALLIWLRRHRLEAAKKLKWKKITCTVFDDMEADEAELVEIDENLIRADLSPAERALQIGRRQELYEKKHGKAKARGGHASQAAQGHKANAKLAVAFTKDATKKTRQSERTVQRDATRAKKAAVLPDIAGTPLDKGAEIDALAKLPVEKQRSLAEAAKRGEQVTAIRLNRLNSFAMRLPAPTRAAFPGFCVVFVFAEHVRARGGSCFAGSAGAQSKRQGP